MKCSFYARRIFADSAVAVACLMYRIFVLKIAPSPSLSLLTLQGLIIIPTLHQRATHFFVQRQVLTRGFLLVGWPLLQAKTAYHISADRHCTRPETSGCLLHGEPLISYFYSNCVPRWCAISQSLYPIEIVVSTDEKRQPPPRNLCTVPRSSKTGAKSRSVQNSANNHRLRSFDEGLAFLSRSMPDGSSPQSASSKHSMTTGLTNTWFWRPPLKMIFSMLTLE